MHPVRILAKTEPWMKKAAATEKDTSCSGSFPVPDFQSIRSAPILPAAQPHSRPVCGAGCFHGSQLSGNALSQHGLCYLLKAGDVGACHIITSFAIAFCGIIQIVENIDHNALQLAVHFFEGPA